MGYKGIIELAYRSGEILEIYVEKVRKGDEFYVTKGSDRKIIHKDKAGTPERDSKTHEEIITHYYAEYVTRSGGRIFKVWTREQIEEHMNKFSPAAKNDKFSPWKTSFDLMAQKTVIKDLLRYAPLSKKDKRVLSADETVKKEIAKDMLGVKPVYEFDPSDTKGLDDADFIPKTTEDPEKEDPEKPETKKKKGSSKKTGVGPKPRKGESKKTGKDKETGAKSGSGDNGTTAGNESTVPENMDTTAVTDKQLDRLFAMAKKAYPEMDSETVKNKVKEKFKLNSLRELVKFQYDQVCDTLEKVAKMNEDKEEGQQVIEDFEKHLDQE